MDQIRIAGGRPLRGVIPISGAKNAALPLMTASLLSDGPLTLRNVPKLADIQTLSGLLSHHGVSITEVPETARRDDLQGKTLRLGADKVAELTAPYDLVRKMRASVLVLGPLLARFGQARVSLPGGCAIGNRPVDLHLSGMEKLGATVELSGGYIEARAPSGGLKGARIEFPKVSVGATENLMMAASLAKGETVLVNAAREPEIVDLAACLRAMGVEIEGAGTPEISIQGATSLHEAEHQVIADRIEAGTYAMAAAVTGGDLLLKGADLIAFEAAADILQRAGVHLTQMPDGVRVEAGSRIRGVDVITDPYPGFPTDLQAQIMAVMCACDGAAMITETIFENRFMHVPELRRMGADVTVHNASALVRGQDRLIGAPVMATDLRASVSLVLAGLAAEGETLISRVYHLDRGYEEVERKLADCGAIIERIAEGGLKMTPPLETGSAAVA